MSGGHFDYVQYRVGQAADEVDSFIRSCESVECAGFGYKPPAFAAETIAKFRECERTLRLAAEMLQRVDWLASGDDGEETFHERWRIEVSKLQSANKQPEDKA